MAKNLVLVLNCGSSSIKFAVIDPKTTELSLSGLVQKIGSIDASVKYTLEEQTTSGDLPNIDYHKALAFIIEIIRSSKKIVSSLTAIGHRVVHGGGKLH